MRRWLVKFIYDITIVGLILLFLLLLFFGRIVHTIPAGHVGVFWSRFGGGTRLDLMLGEGVRLTLPWDAVYVYDVRLQQRHQVFDTLTADGLKVRVDIGWRYRLVPRSVPLLHQFVGPRYEAVMLNPDIGQRARDLIALYRPDDLYTARRLSLQTEIRDAVAWNMTHNLDVPNFSGIEFIVIQNISIRDVEFPPDVQQAIVRKNEAFQRIQENGFRIDAERKEAERRRVEAEGIRSFQEIVSSSLSPGYLRWRGIEATLELAKSKNSKVVVIGSGREGLPLILNAESAADPSAVTPAASHTDQEVPAKTPEPALSPIRGATR
ncbi:prohibitin family protein [Bradyrhizobium ontarionense]|uniref:Prohibitin family protein n=1 Tax=Bradyrhizobium ontarionense TaxID=2898149 RepID=A0ABY3RBG6_9BRAD|nr:prohibitin family protein [Bradyrhizobium sp. A19]UFZ04102.1 prohibitin family protein [Bradyrhizobium sp. A19]